MSNSAPDSSDGLFRVARLARLNRGAVQRPAGDGPVAIRPAPTTAGARPGHEPRHHSSPRPRSPEAHSRPLGISGLRRSVNDVRRNYPKTVVPVPVARIVPVAVSAAHVPRIIVVGAPAQRTRHRLGPAFTAAQDQAAVCRTVRCQPPSRRPISVTIAAACWYCPGLNHCHFSARRR